MLEHVSLEQPQLDYATDYSSTHTEAPLLVRGLATTHNPTRAQAPLLVCWIKTLNIFPMTHNTDKDYGFEHNYTDDPCDDCSGADLSGWLISGVYEPQQHSTVDRTLDRVEAALYKE